MPPLWIVNLAGTRTFVAPPPAAPTVGPVAVGPEVVDAAGFVAAAVPGTAAEPAVDTAACVEPPQPASGTSAAIKHRHGSRRLKLLTRNADN